MNEHRITLLGSHDRILKEWLTSHPDGHERGAIVLFRRISRKVNGLPKSDRFLSVEIIRMEGDWIIDSSINQFTINMRKFPDLFFRCENENLELGFAHNHPDGHLYFSEMDDINEKNILHGLSGSNTPFSFLISLIFSDNLWIGRIRQGVNPDIILGIRHISVLNEKLDLYGIQMPEELPISLKRQEKAFGKPFNVKLQSLRVAIIGLGGTGSPIANLLARTGVGELILIDGDSLDESNLNRVSGFSKCDIGLNKANIVMRYIKCLGLRNKVVAIPKYINESSEALDAISSADVIFGCTDDVAGRDLLNQALYYYSQVYIDVGLSGNVDKDEDGNPYLRTQKGRVSCILPEYGSCLRCQNVINDQMLSDEQKLKDNPELADLDPEILKKHYYIFGANVQSPGIGAFTRGTADNAVATLMNLVSSYRYLPSDLRQDNIWIDFIHLNIHSNTPRDIPECIYCKKHLLFTQGEGKYRLGTPQYGKIPMDD
ncbi:MAG: ThiF family adenylyltransferase [Porphyromonadaceae bacterium]|jgi:molybdopterin/thiamine biosynthesis adenylyltransferase|nr:ThiF family adenylyltransferase [Porphyromonadaceae bacterium]